VCARNANADSHPGERMESVSPKKRMPSKVARGTHVDLVLCPGNTRHIWKGAGNEERF